MIVNLNTIVPDKLVCPAGKRRIEYVDTGGTGLYCECRATSPGQGTYYLRYRDANNITRHVKVGTTMDTELNQAREKSKRMKAQITLGADPSGEKKAKNDVVSFHDFFQKTYMSHAKVHSRGWKKKSQMYNLRLKKAFGHKRLDQIQTHQVTTWHSGLVVDGLSPAYADRFLALLRHALNMAVAWGMLEKNQAAHVKQFNPDNSVEQHLNEAELKRLLKVLRTDKNRTVCLIALFLLATGTRLQESLQAKWADIDRENMVWRIPAANAKSKRSRLVPLNSFAIKNVLDLLDSEGKYDHLFINRKTGKPYVTIAKSWDRLRCDANLPEFKLHSLRRTYASYIVNNGHSLLLASRLLGHSDPSITARHYAILASDSIRSASESVAEVLNRSMPESQ